MDPVTAALLTAIAAGAAKVGEQILVDGYAALKSLLGRKFGSESKVVKAVDELEANPNSAARKEVVKEEVAMVKADQDQEIVQMAQSLLESVQALPGGKEIVQSAIGDQNIQIAGSGNSVSVNTPKVKR
jgi:hypothetical protein